MKKILVLALGLVLSAARTTVAATATERIAYDGCFGFPSTRCGIMIASIFGTGPDLFVGDGVQPTWSPDGSKIAFVGYGGGPGIFILDFADWSVINLTGVAGASSPAWSPDGTTIAYVALGDVYLASVDGSGSVRLTSGGQALERTGWSPDGARVTFDCLIDASNGDICAIGADGTGLVRLTDDPAWDFQPSFSPDGETIAFATERYGDPAIATMTSSGGSVTRVGEVSGFWPSWSPDGGRLAFFLPSPQGEGCPAGGSCVYGMSIMYADGTGPEVLNAQASHPSWTGWTQPLRPIASFHDSCVGLQCGLDGTPSLDPDGTIAGHAWDFGDGTTGSGATASHTYAGAGTYAVTLTVTDDDGLTGTRVLPVTVALLPPMPPVAMIDVSCAQVVCTFNGSASWDPDATIVSHEWNFGDGATGSGATATHTYATPGTYTVTLTVTDDDGLTGTRAQALTVTTTQSHVGDLDGAVTQGQGTRTARVTATVHDTIEARLPNAVLTGYWSVGGTSSSCTTDAAGQCTVARSFANATRTVTFSVGSVTHPTKTYVPSQNHDPDGNSTGTSIVVRRN
jgi:PKD repeat protein